MSTKKKSASALRRLKQEDPEFEDNLGCTERPCLKKTKINKYIHKNKKG
jgi:hypothetical protein